MNRIERGWASVWRLIVPCFVSAIAACAPPLTQVVVAVDTTYAVPDQLDRIVIDVTGPSGNASQASGTLSGTSSLPVTLGITAASGSENGTVTVTVTGQHSGVAVITRVARFAFFPQETRLLRISLDPSCMNVNCGSAQTCDETGCRSEVVDPSELTPWTGTIPPHDGSTMTTVDASLDARSDVTITDTQPPRDTAPTTVAPGGDCSGGRTCAAGTYCIALANGDHSCVYCGSEGDRCCNGTTCDSSLRCLIRGGSTRTYCLNPSQAAGTTGGPCGNNSSCSAGSVGGCLPFSGPTNAGNYCIRCGDIGWPCCTNEVCTTGTCIVGADGFNLCRP